MSDWIRDYYDEVDAMNASGSVAHFTDDGTFQLGNLPVAVGRAEIAAASQAFWDRIAGLRHDFTHRHTDGNTEIIESDVTYELKNGSTVTITGIAVLECEGDAIAHSRSYIDLAPIWESAARPTQDETPQEWVTRYIAAVDTLEVDRMIPFFAPDATLSYANNPPMVGHAAIRAGLEPFHASIGAISHKVVNCFPSGPGVIVAEYEASYTRLDGQVVNLPGIGVFELSDGLISAYRVYVDIAPVFAQSDE